MVLTQAVIPKASPEAISPGGGLIVGGLLVSLGVNDNNNISGISNFIPIPSNVWHVAKKSREDTFRRIAGFVYNYPCSMSYNTVELSGI